MKKNKILITSLIIIFILGIVFIYFENYYHAKKEALRYLTSTNTVKISKNNDYYLFDGKGKNKALIFYPGAKVESESYARLMYELADKGIDCFLVNMPFRFAFFGANKADKILNNYNYDTWIMSGHSLGGVVVSSYATSNKPAVDYLVLLASYSTKKINNDVKLLSIYGEKDSVLNIDAYEKNKKNWPKVYDEKIITGGNHANFGDYGFQKKDTKADISNTKQQNQVVEYILSFIK